MSLLRAAAGAGGEVALLDQAGRQAAGDRVERGAGADDAAADDEHVELVALEGPHRRQRSVTGFRAEGAGLAHAAQSVRSPFRQGFAQPIGIWKYS